MNTTTAPQTEDLYIRHFRFLRNQDGELVKIPSSEGLHGFLVIDSDKNIYRQVQLLESSETGIKECYEEIWGEIHKQDDSILFPGVLTQGMEDDVLFYVSSLPNGEPVDQFLNRTPEIPTPLACQMVARFIGRLRSQQMIPVDRFIFRESSLWIENRIVGPRIVLGDIAPVPSEGAEAANVQMCLDFLSRLAGNPFDSEFLKLRNLVKAGPGTMAHLEKSLSQYLEVYPANGEYWSTANEPRQILESLVSSKEFADEIAISPDTGPVAVKPKSFIEKLKYIAGVASVLVCVGLTVNSFKGDPHKPSELTSPPQIEENETAMLPVPELTLPEAQPVDIVMEPLEPLSMPGPGMKFKTKTRKFTPVPLAVEIDIDIDEAGMALAHEPAPEKKQAIEFDLDHKLPGFLKLKEMATILPSIPLKSSRVPDTTIEPKRLPESRHPVEVDLAAIHEPQMVAKTIEMIVDENPADEIKRLSLQKIGGIGIDAWRKRESGEELFLKTGATGADFKNGYNKFLEAAEMGDAAAQFLVGECLVTGIGTQKNPNRGIFWLEQAVAQKENRAMNLLGTCYLNGWGVVKNEVEAVRLFQAAVDYGNIQAYYNLGARYAQGQGVSRNSAAAADLFQIGAERGHARCMVNYARCFETGYGRSENYKKAVYWFRRSAQAANYEAINWCEENYVAYRVGR